MDKTRLNQIDKLLKEALKLKELLEIKERKIGHSASFAISGYVGRNGLGDLLRKGKVSSINTSLDKVQKELLDFHKDLALFDDRLANRLELPSKLSEVGQTRNPVSDIILRSEMRKKEFEVTRQIRKLDSIIDSLTRYKKMEIFKLRKEKQMDVAKN